MENYTTKLQTYWAKLFSVQMLQSMCQEFLLCTIGRNDLLVTPTTIDTPILSPTYIHPSSLFNSDWFGISLMTISVLFYFCVHIVVL